MNIQKNISYQNNQKRVNQILPVIIDRKEENVYIGRTEYDSVDVDNEVIIRTTKNLQLGDFVNVKIVSAMEYDLEAELV